MGKKKRISFEEWIDEVSMKRIAVKLGIDISTVCKWRTCKSDPTVNHMRAIKRWTRGKMGYEQMIERATPTNTFAQAVQE